MTAGNGNPSQITENRDGFPMLRRPDEGEGQRREEQWCVEKNSAQVNQSDLGKR